MEILRIVLEGRLFGFIPIKWSYKIFTAEISAIGNGINISAGPLKGKLFITKETSNP